MASLSGTNKALLVIDAQNAILSDCHERDRTVAKMAEAVERARVASLPVVWVQHSDSDIIEGSEQWKIVPELTPKSSEKFVGKKFRSSFVSTSLHRQLQAINIGHIIVCGAESNNCVRHTIHSAIDLGYDVTLIQDAHTAISFEWNGFVVDAQKVIDEQNANFMSYQTPGSHVQSKLLDELDF